MTIQLRLGLLLDSLDVPAWVFQAVQQLLANPAVEVALLIVNLAPAAKARPGWPYRLYDRLDERLFAPTPSAWQPKPLGDLFTAPQILQAQPVSGPAGVELAPETAAKIKAWNLDVLLSFGFAGLHGEVAQAARYGLWFFAADEPGPGGYWEVLGSQPESQLTAASLSDRPGRQGILSRSIYFTYPFSAARNVNALAWQAADVFPRLIERLQRLGPDEFFAGIEPEPLAALLPAADVEQPSNRAARGQVLRQVGKVMTEVRRRAFYRPTWYLLYDPHTTGADFDFHFAGFTRLMPPKDRFWADPHAVCEAGRSYVFIEEYLYQTGKGHIAVIEIDPQGACQPPVRVLETDYHLSYPFVFQWQGQYFMIPETAHKRTIDLYECVEFPYRWQFRQSLMENVRAVDTTLLYDQERWWLFTALSRPGGAALPSDLFLFSAPDLFAGGWVSHPRNPIVSDIKKGRPAGRLFRQDGRLYRPSQYSRETYGCGFDLNEVLRLSETDYAEQSVCTVRPTWDRQAQATHTFSQAGSLTIIDAFTYRRKFG